MTLVQYSPLRTVRDCGSRQIITSQSDSKLPKHIVSSVIMADYFLMCSVVGNFICAV